MDLSLIETQLIQGLTEMFKKDGGLPPTALLACCRAESDDASMENVVVVIQAPALGDDPADSKQRWYDAVRGAVLVGIARGYDPSRMLVVLGFEAWVATMPLNENPANMVPPSESDNRREMLIVYTERSEGTPALKAREIRRCDDGVSLGAEDDTFNGGAISGAAVGFFP